MTNITEGLSPVIYHYTSLPILYKILSKNVFLLTPVLINKSEENVGSKKSYFLSTTRSRHGNYHSGNKDGALIKMDGTKLSQNYSGSPVAYYEHGISDEMEDRIIHNLPTIPSLKFITHIDLVSPNISNDLMRIVKLCISHSISFTVYTDMKSLITRDKVNTLTINDTSSSVDDAEDTKNTYPDIIEALDEFLHITALTSDSITKEDTALLRDFLKDGYNETLIWNIRRAAKLTSDEDLSKRIQRISYLVRKSKVSGIMEYIKLLKQQLSSIYNDIGKKERHDYRDKHLVQYSDVVDNILLNIKNGTVRDIDLNIFDKYNISKPMIRSMRLETILQALIDNGFITFSDIILIADEYNGSVTLADDYREHSGLNESTTYTNTNNIQFDSDLERIISIALEQDPSKYDNRTHTLLYYITNDIEKFFNVASISFNETRSKSTTNPTSLQRITIDKLVKLMDVYGADSFHVFLTKVTDNVIDKRNNI